MGCCASNLNVIYHHITSCKILSAREELQLAQASQRDNTTKADKNSQQLHDASLHAQTRVPIKAHWTISVKQPTGRDTAPICNMLGRVDHHIIPHTLSRTTRIIPSTQRGTQRTSNNPAGLSMALCQCPKHEAPDDSRSNLGPCHTKSKCKRSKRMQQFQSSKKPTWIYKVGDQCVPKGVAMSTMTG